MVGLTSHINNNNNTLKSHPLSSSSSSSIPILPSTSTSDEWDEGDSIIIKMYFCFDLNMN